MWIMNLTVMIHKKKDVSDMVDSRIHTLHSYTHFIEFWNKLVEVVEDLEKNFLRTFERILKC